MPSSSSAAAGALVGVYLYNSTKGRVAYVGVPPPLPALILYLGNYYVWSPVNQIYQVQTAYSASITTRPAASPAASPVF